MGGGAKRKTSFIEYTKHLIDELNAYHATKSDNLNITKFTNTTFSIHYYDSIIVIEKRLRDKNSVATAIIGDDKFCFV
ncbi:hypothetical protein ACWIUD_02255 [Helicobacter sp. 23-1044]